MKSKAINNRSRAKQLLGFDNMKYGRCSPTDIDMSLDFQGNVFIFTELKGGKAPLTLGQRIHLMSIVDALESGGKEAYAILAHHDTANPEHDVMVGESVVAAVYSQGAWSRDVSGRTLDRVITDIHNAYQLERGCDV